MNPRIKVISPPAIPARKLPACEAKVMMTEWTEEWRKKRGYGETCAKKAHFEIDGQKLCKLHAGEKALAIMLEN